MKKQVNYFKEKILPQSLNLSALAVKMSPSKKSQRTSGDCNPVQLDSSKQAGALFTTYLSIKAICTVPTQAQSVSQHQITRVLQHVSNSKKI